MDYNPTTAALIFKAMFDYIPVSVLALIRYLPFNPWLRVRNLNDLYRRYGKQILREQGPDVDTEKKGTSKDIMSILSKRLS